MLRKCSEDPQPWMFSQLKKIDSHEILLVHHGRELMQAFPYENHCGCYKKLASRSCPLLVTLTYFFLIYTLSSSLGE